MMKKLIYGQLKKTMTKKAVQFYGDHELETDTIKLEAFHSQDILKVELTFLNRDLVYQEDLKISENSENVGLFFSQIHNQLADFQDSIYSKLTINFNRQSESLELLYINKSGAKKAYSQINTY